jgi:benzoate-CoA ligase
VLVAEPAVVDALGPQLVRLPRLRVCIADGGAPDGVGAAAAGAPDRLEAEPMRDEDMALWLYTSGTTGTPKAAVHLHRDLVAGRPYGVEVLGVGADDRVLATSRLFFAYALGTALLVPFLVGASTCLCAEWPEPRTVADSVRRHRPTVLFSVPTFYGRMLRTELPPDAFRPLRFAVSAGERLPPEIYHAYRERFGLEIVDGLGATETIFMALSNRPGRSRPGSSGTPVPGTEARLVDVHGRDVAAGEDGALHVRMASTSPFYWGRVEASRRAFADGWFRTGDVYARDADGFYHHRGREDDFFKVAGQWVAPAQVEAALLRHPDVTDAAVVGLAEPGGLIKACAFVVARSGAGAGLDAALHALAEAALPPHQRPRRILMVSELPRTATGKLQRFRLVDAAAPGGGARP